MCGNSSGLSIRTISPCFDVSEDSNTSVAVDLGNQRLVALILPILTGATLTVYTSETLTGTYVLCKSSADDAITITAGGTAMYRGLTAAHTEALRGARFIKLESAGTEAADRAITFVTESRP